MGRHALDPGVSRSPLPGAKRFGRRPILLPVLTLVLWLVVAVLWGPSIGKLSDAQTNDNTAFLPANSETVAVDNRLKAFSDKQVLPAIAVFAADRPMDVGDLTKLRKVTDAVAKLPGLTARPTPPLPSRDAEAAQLIVPIDNADAAASARTAQQVRDTVRANTPPGIRSYLTGPGGYSADLAEVFGGIDGQLLLVTAAIVAIILVLVYRSPLLPILVLFSALFALVAAGAVLYPLAHSGLLTLNGQTQGILFILVFGAATDYALLLVARYREELRRPQSLGSAMRSAMRASLEPIGASGGTVIAGMLCMLLSQLSSNAALGPVGAIGIAASLLASLTFLPAVLTLCGRGAFFPRKPAPHSHELAVRTVYTRAADMVGRHPRRVWAITVLVLLAGVLFAGQLKASGIAQRDLFLTKVDAVTGQDVLAAHFPAGSGTPTAVVARADHAKQVTDAAVNVPGVATVAVVPKDPTHPKAGAAVAGGDVQINVTLSASADSDQAVQTVRSLRTAVHGVSGADAQVGGQTASQLDVQDAATRDRSVIVPVVLVVIFGILALLLRALVAPLLLIATVVLSYGATLGVGALVFDHVLDYPGSDPSVPLYAFVFLVALGIDYNIFLMTRVREESKLRGTRKGTLRGLTVTGGVITSAGVVLAATFAALSVLPILFLAQIAFLVAFGVLLDTVVVRSLLVPALAVDVGRFIWWPSRLARRERRGGRDYAARGEFTSATPGVRSDRLQRSHLGRNAGDTA